MVDVARIRAGPKTREWARKHGFAEWMVARWARLAPDPAHFLEGITKRPPTYLRVNPLKTSVAELMERLEARGFTVARTEFDPWVVRVVEAPISPGATIEHLLGMTSPQDLASAAGPLALGPRRGEVVADLAAAPGVKTLHVAALMEDDGVIVASEPDEDRMQALRFNLERSGITSTVLHRCRAEEMAGDAWADKILLDAPCTGEGTLPKDRKRRRGKPEEIKAACEVQSTIADAADRMLRPGGEMVYATCTFAPEENEAQVQRLIDRGYEMLDLPFDACEGVPLLPAVQEWPGLELDPSLAKARRFAPGIHPTLGFFVARLRKEDA